MFNNKGPESLIVSPVIFSLNGERLDLPALTISATSYQEYDLRDLLAGHLPQFSEGSIQVTHQGQRLQLGAQVKILKQGLIFDEQFITPATRFPSSQMENVWWLPSSKVNTKFIISNTSNETVSATIVVEGTSPKQHHPAAIQLAPHQTKVLNVLKDLVGQTNGGMMHSNGGISINHSGSPGAIIARLLISDESTGFSSIAGFVDPTNFRSSKLNGGGLRLGKVGNDELIPVLIAKNRMSESTIVRGRIPYTNVNGDVVFVNIPDIQLAARETKAIDIAKEIKQAKVAASVEIAGIDLEYTTAPGSVVLNVLSVSKSGQQVFQVPLLDPEKMPSSAGGFPWKVDEDYTTLVYIKNETNTLKKYVPRLMYEGGGYTLGIQTIKPYQTVVIDFKSLRDNQVPDTNGNIIPLNVGKGQIAWTMFGKDNNTLSGRSEQINTAKGVSSTYACYNCCPDSGFSNGVIYPVAPYPGTYTDIGLYYDFMQGVEVFTQSCYNVQSPPFLDIGNHNWASSNSNMVTVDYGGMVSAIDEGGATISSSYTYYYYNPQGCFMESATVPGSTFLNGIFANDVVWKTVRTGTLSANFDPGISNVAELNVGTGTGGASRCSISETDGNPFDITVSFALPPGAQSIFSEPRTDVREPDNAQFRINFANRPEANFASREGTWEVRMRRVRTTGPNFISFRISGALQQGEPIAEGQLCGLIAPKLRERKLIMQYLPKIFFLFCICATSLVAQIPTQQNKLQFVEVPREIILPVIAVQPGCPLQFENVVSLAGVGGGGINSYRLRNIGAKPIKKFVVATSQGSTFTWALNSGELVIPGQLVPQQKDERSEIIPLNNELSEKLKLKGEMKGIVILMIVSVEFSDGTKYDDEKTFKAMEKFSENLVEALYEQKQRSTKPSQ